MPHNCLEQYFKAQVRRLVREKRSGPSINFPESNFLKKVLYVGFNDSKCFRRSVDLATYSFDGMDVSNIFSSIGCYELNLL